MKVGDVIAERYSIVTILAHGGTSQVLLCEDQRLPGARWVVKIADASAVPSGVRLDTLLEAEAALQVQLQHPAVPRIVDRLAGDHGTFGLVMEHCPGETLEARVRRDGPLPETEALRIASEVAAFLSYLHRLDPPVFLIDLQPANVMIGPGGGIRLIDFGLAQRGPGPAQGGREGFVAPEVTKRAVAVSDVYALAAVLCFMLSGKVGTHPPSGLSLGCRSLLRVGLSSKPESRPSADQFRGRLEQARQSQDTTRRTQKAVPRTGLVAAALLMMVACVCLVAGLILQGTDPVVRASPTPARAVTRTPVESPKPLEKEIHNEQDGSVLVAVPGGSYQVGSTETEVTQAAAQASLVLPDFESKWLESEAPSHRVDVASFYIGRQEVTNAQYRRFVAATGFKPAGNWEEYALKWGEEAPVVGVSAFDAKAYCDWAGLRLPTEEEWEVAARGPNGRQYPWGNEWDAALCWNSVGSRRAKPSAVGRHPGGASWCGAEDMAGNVWEWTDSGFEPYPGSSASNNAYGKGYRVLRGGSWDNNSPVYFRAATRIRYSPPNRFSEIGGFRCAKDL